MMMMHECTNVMWDVQKKKTPSFDPFTSSAAFSVPPSISRSRSLASHHPGHAAHATHTGHTAHSSTGRLLLRVHHTSLAGRQQRRDTRSVDEGSSDDLERVEDTGRDHVAVLRGGGVVSPVELVLRRVLLREQFAYDDGSFFTGVLDDSACRSEDGVSDHRDTEFLIEVVDAQPVELGRCFLNV